MGQRLVGAEEDDPIDSRCTKAEQSNLEASDVFLTKTMLRIVTLNMLDAGDA